MNNQSLVYVFKIIVYVWFINFIVYSDQRVIIKIGNSYILIYFRDNIVIRNKGQFKIE